VWRWLVRTLEKNCALRSRSLTQFDVSGSAPREVARFPTVRQPNTVGTDPETGRVFVASRTDGQLQLIDPPN
jgi:hypothetical protein